MVRDILANLKRDIFLSLNCVKIGQITAFDDTRRTVRVQLLFKRVLPNGALQSYPALVDCPVFILQGGGSAVQLQITPGDQCIVLFADRNIDAWFKSGTEQPPFDGRAHDLSDGIALVGVNSLASQLESYEPDAFRLFFSGTTGAELRLLDGAASLRSAKNETMAEINMAAQMIEIKNATTSLLTLMNAFITVLEGLQVTGPLPLTPASIAALEAQKAQFATLLL